MVLSCDGVSLLFSNLSLSQILKATGALIRKQFIVFPEEAPLSPDPIRATRVIMAKPDRVGSGVKYRVNYS